MLKGFVSGEEKDIKRIPMGTRNLFDGDTAYGAYKQSNNRYKATIAAFYVIHVMPFTSDDIGKTYTFSFTINELPTGALNVRAAANVNGTSVNGNNLSAPGTTKIVFTVSSENDYLYVNYGAGGTGDMTISNIMLNLGSTPLPYEPYGYQEGWEVRDSQDRLIWGREDELQTATGTLPFKGYSLPLKVKSLLGNAVQNGTPSPGPVNPNLADPSKTVPGYQESNGSIHTPSAAEEITTDFIPFTNTLYILISGSTNGDMNYAAYNANKQIIGIYNTGFTPNTVITANPQTYTGAAYLRVSWTHGANQPICITTKQTTTFIPFDPNPPGPVIPEMCGVLNENLAIIDTDSYSLNNWYYEDTRLTDLLAPGTYTISFVTDSVTAGTTADGTIGIGTTSDYTEDLEWFTRAAVGSMTTVTVTLSESKCLWARFVRDHNIVKITCSISVSKIRVEEGSMAYRWKIPFENHGENLLRLYKSGYRYDNNGNEVEYSSTNIYAFSAKATKSYTINWSYPAGVATNTVRIYGFYQGTPVVLITVNINVNSVPYTFTTDVTIDEYRLSVSNQVYNMIANEGSTPKPYSPYLNETIPVYLGEVPTVRRVKKVVLTGDENWQRASGTMYLSELAFDYKRSPSNVTYICSHYGTTPQVNSAGSVVDGTMSMAYDTNNQRLYIRDTAFSSAADFKSYLATQYAAGTPVCVWYVLANEQIGISNEPLCKISTYADELTTIQVHGLSAPLYGIGDYKDTLNLSTGVVTRKVKRLVFDGTENWQKVGEGSNEQYFRVIIGNYGDIVNTADAGGFCTHLVAKSITSQTRDIGFSCSNVTSQNWAFCNIRKEVNPTLSTTAFKNWLAAQYQAGTPVTIWYILDTPTTETVTVPTGMTGEIEGYLTQVSTPTPTNRSVPKWNGVEETGGTYAVTVYTPPEIPTTTGENTLTVETEKIHGLTNPLCGIGDYKDVLNLSTGVITRKVKKLVLTGTEDWERADTGSGGSLKRVYMMLQRNALVYDIGICTHYKYEYANENGNCYVGSQKDRIYFIDNTNAATTDVWKTYLAAQYQAGTPVTIWYVLETPETETITVPYGLECSVEGYLTQSDTPTPSSPITPDSNGILESGGTYAVEVSLVPSNLTVKGHIKELT